METKRRQREKLGGKGSMVKNEKVSKMKSKSLREAIADSAYGETGVLEK